MSNKQHSTKKKLKDPIKKKSKTARNWTTDELNLFLLMTFFSETIAPLDLTDNIIEDTFSLDHDTCADDTDNFIDSDFDDKEEIFKGYFSIYLRGGNKLFRIIHFKGHKVFIWHIFKDQFPDVFKGR